MNWFRKMKKPESEIHDQLVFNDNIGAFKYACKFLDTSLADEKAVLGIVLAVGDSQQYFVKLSNPDDPTIPSGDIQELLTKSSDRNLCPGAPAADRVPLLSKGDLVMCRAPSELVMLGRGALGAIIVDKIKPIYDINTGWVIDRESEQAI